MIAHLESAPAASSDARMLLADAQQLIDKAPLTSGAIITLNSTGEI
jgi:hypothetical protein